MRGPHDLEPTRGAVLPLSDTFCERVFATQRALSFADAGTPGWSDHPARLALGFGSYLGAPVRAGGDRFGTLCFASFGPAREPFTATQRDLANLLAQWAGFVIGRAIANASVGSGTAAETLAGCRRGATGPDRDLETETGPEGHRARSPRPEQPNRRAHASSAAQTLGSALDVNGALDRMRGLLAQCAGEKIELTLRLSSGLRAARSPGAAFRPLVLDLVRHAVASLPAGGRIELETNRVGPAAFSNDARSDAKSAAAGYVTLAVRVTGEDVAVGGTDAHFGAAPGVGAAGATPRPADAVRSISEIERILHPAGGDLSVAVEPGRGSTCTVFLPELPEGGGAAAASSAATTATAAAAPDRRDGAGGPVPGTQLSFLT